MLILSWITGWINVAGWIALVASAGLLGSQLIVGIISLMNPVSYCAAIKGREQRHRADYKADLYS